MVRQSLSIPKYAAILVSTGIVSGCVSLGVRNEATPGNDPAEPESPVASSNSESGFSLAGLFLGKNKKSDPLEKPDGPSDLIPRKIPIGTVHFVHVQGGFVLIELTGMPSIPDQAELMTYSEEGKPTGKLRISPERKGNFRVGDILAGHPQDGDRVMLFGMAGADGELLFDGDPDPDAPEVLE